MVLKALAPVWDVPMATLCIDSLWCCTAATDSLLSQSLHNKPRLKPCDDYIMWRGQDGEFTGETTSDNSETELVQISQLD